MERVSLRQAFHGEPDNAEDGVETGGKGPDEVNITIKGGKLTLRVPNAVPDDQVITQERMDEFLQAVLELEDGSELTIILDPSTDLADTRLIRASERSRESEG